MGVITLEKSDHLFWLGRYSERAYTTLKTFYSYYDKMIDVDENIYSMFCKKLCIPDIYEDKTTFFYNYLYDEHNPDSICTSMTRAFDNAVVMRNELGSETLAYVQMALDVLKSSKTSPAPLIRHQEVLDYILAFWGSVDDNVGDPEAQQMLKCGKHVERLDLYIRFDYPYQEIEKEFQKLSGLLQKSKNIYTAERLNSIQSIVSKVEEWKEHYWDALNHLGRIYEVG